MFSQLWERLCTALNVQIAAHKKLLGWCLACLVAGIILAIITLMVGEITTDDINTRFIDGNIINMTSLDAGLGNFIWQRILSLMIPVVILFVAALISRGTAVIIFPIVIMHGYWLCLSVWWTLMYFTINAIPLLIFYIFWLLLVTAILFLSLIWCLQVTANLRLCHCHDGHTWWQVGRGAAIILSVAVILGFFEYLIFWLILGKIVYRPI